MSEVPLYGGRGGVKKDSCLKDSSFYIFGSRNTDVCCMLRLQENGSVTPTKTWRTWCTRGQGYLMFKKPSNRTEFDPCVFIILPRTDRILPPMS